MLILTLALSMSTASAAPANCASNHSSFMGLLKRLCSPMNKVMPKSLCGEDGPRVRFLGEINLRELADRKGVDGLSSLTYDEKSDTFYAISDNGHAEILRFRLDLKRSPPGFEKLPSIPLQARSGYNDKEYIPPTTPGYVPTYDDIEDLEALTRKADGSFYLLRESSRGAGTAILHYSPEGKYLGQVPPATLNSTEGLSLTPSQKAMWQSSEGGLTIDGKDYTDVHHFSACEGKEYCRDKAVLFPPTNDVSEIAALDEERLLTLERHWDGKMVHAKIGLIDTAGASDVGVGVADYEKRQKVTLPADFKMAERREIVDLNELEGFKRVDNLEGMTLGPRTGEGKRSLILVSDDNGNSKQLNQLVVLEVPEKLLEKPPLTKPLAGQ